MSTRIINVSSQKFKDDNYLVDIRVEGTERDINRILKAVADAIYETSKGGGTSA